MIKTVGKEERKEVNDYSDFLEGLKDGDRVFLEVFYPEDKDKSDAGFPNREACWKYYSGCMSITQHNCFFEDDNLIRDQGIDLDTGEAACGHGVRIVPVS